MEKIYVGKLGKAVGLKGQIRLFIESDFPNQFSANKTFTTQKKQILQIETINGAKDLVKFIGIDRVEDAKKLTNSLLYTTSEESLKNCKLGKNQFFWFDIIGCQIKENGILLGEVIDIQRLPLDDYLYIKTSQALLATNEKGAKNFMIPYNENFILEVALEKKNINTQNCFDIYEAS